MPKRKVKRQKSKGKIDHRRILILYLALSAIFVSIPIVSALAKIVIQPCANSISCIKDLSGKFESESEGVFLGQKIAVPSYLASIPFGEKVLGRTSGPKHISVDLSKQRLYAHEGDKKVLEFPVSTGKWGRTPPGEYKIWVKLLRTRMSGGSGNDYYNLPNVPYTMFFYSESVPKSRGFALHGAYWHNNFGYTMS
ncbi:MAG: L,D-transpeptidase, partial [Patescibacteria group bacterium]